MKIGNRLRRVREERGSYAVAAQHHDDPPSGEVRGVYYTSCLDDQTCTTCAAADDGLLRRMDDPARICAPHPGCSNPEGCRCMDVYVLNDEVPPAGGYAWSAASARLNENRWGS
jgi:hypothetical protein